MSELRKAAEQALESLKTAVTFANHMGIGDWQPTAMTCHESIAALRAALAGTDQEQSEPVGWSITFNGEHCGNLFFLEDAAIEFMESLNEKHPDDVRSVVPLFSTPPRREPEQSEPEPPQPVMWAFQYADGTWHDASATEHSAGMKPLFNHAPPRREPLTPEQIGAIMLKFEGTLKSLEACAREIERQHGIGVEP